MIEKSTRNFYKFGFNWDHVLMCFMVRC